MDSKGAIAIPVFGETNASGVDRLPQQQFGTRYN